MTNSILSDVLAGVSPDVPPRRNIELKARIADLDQARTLAQRIATGQLAAQHQIDTYFHVAHGRLKLREINGQEAQLVWYRRPNDQESRLSQYVLVSVAEPSLLKGALAGALGICNVIDKQREIHLYQNVRIHLDRVAGQGTFLEFEAVLAPEQAEAEGYAQLDFLRRHFGLRPADLIAHSYGDVKSAGPPDASNSR